MEVKISQKYVKHIIALPILPHLRVPLFNKIKIQLKRRQRPKTNPRIIIKIKNKKKDWTVVSKAQLTK